MNKAGTPNWVFDPAPKASGKQDRKAPTTAQKSTSSNAGAVHKLNDINLKISLPSLDDPMKAEGAVTWNKEKIELLLGLSNPNGFLNGKKTDIETRISAAPVKLSFKGSAARTTKIKSGGSS